MISFVTSYDEATLCNYEVYVNCGINPTISLLSNDATAANLVSELTQTSRNVFAMSHGDSNKFCDQQGNDTFTVDNLVTLSNGGPFNVFAYACNTSRVLGKVAAHNNIRWFGFVDLINPPDTDTSLQNIYVDIFNFIFVNFPNVSCNTSAMQFLDQLKSLCDRKLADIDAIASSNHELPVVSAYSSVKQIWEKQKIWLSGNNSVVHPEAPDHIYW
ncbi:MULTISPECIES: hypothetical protein [Halomonadaceae]|uniref:hypothetical protein n=1 Tax=Halomonadaceae TaxID=28256 RepID=UPI0012F1D44F|nr:MULTISPECIES: hypothetical protein [Halomonas]CAD5248565.1 hypothetical protein HALO59_100260 [Halomonas sp. 59]CAD5248676.1 hypothetical protein HALO113_100282 [Halomonas sp. 113]CAD5251743.1 hypothetical protein HALO156_110022 [Halomonas sp. 156]CAD5257090.1 hypothetical protein HALOI3_140122 [Halomonas sp. I3]VXC01239.1 hypothetical protein HALO153_230155 [Halomonas titanicae]